LIWLGGAVSGKADVNPSDQERSDLGHGASHGTDRPEYAKRPPEQDDRWLRSVVEKSSEIVTIVDPDGTLRYASPAWQRVLGYDPEEEIGKMNVLDHVHPEDLGHVLEETAEALAEGGIATNTVEYRFRHRDGSWRWMESVGTYLLDDPAVRGVVVTLRDISERKEAEEALRKSEISLAESQRLAHLGTWERNLITDESWWSAETYRIYGFDPGSRVLPLEELMEVVHPDDRDRVEAAMHGALRGAQPYDIEHRIVRSHEEVKWVHIRAEVAWGAEGELLRVVGTVHDVTERKEATTRLTEAEERYRTLVEQIPAVTYIDRVTDGPDEPLYTSPQIERMLGYTPEEWLEDRLWPECIHPEDRKRILAADERFERERQERFGEEYRLLAKDGSVVWVREEAVLVRDEAGAPTFWQGVIFDLTERKETEEALRRSEASLAESQRLAHLGTWEWDVVSGEVWWSEETYRIHGLDPTEGMASLEKVEEALFPEDLPRYRRKIDEALSGEAEGYDHEHRIRRPNGEVRWVHGRAEVVRGEGGEALRMIGTVYDVTERKVLEDRLRHEAYYDTLTDLPNRRLFMDRLGRALARTRRKRLRRVAVLFMDLDNFKVINDSLGHDTGDRLLVEVAKRLKRCLRPEDTLARFGGDEFTVLLEEVAGADEALRVTNRIAKKFRRPFVLDGRRLFVRFSIGVALGDADTESPEELLRNADTAMYRDKEEATDYQMFDPVVYERDLRRLEFENNLQHALEKEEFTLYYQPKFRLGQKDMSETLEALEALVRWKHPQRGLMLPGDFILVAEETGLIIPIGRWIMKEACRQTKGWQERYPSEPPVDVCVNLSTEQVRHPGLIRDVKSALRESNLEPGSLILELTEGTFLKNTELIDTIFGELTALGVRLAIDDFGKEYSSLSYLNKLPLNALKIDRLFLENIGENSANTTILEAVVSLAHSLGLEVTGEGVESAEQLELLRGMGCDFAQGYHLARPLPSEEVERLLADRKTF
jgi:diguanylate cyclase (GGDEF)-like protein/PAS domain S-box-containing protein